MSRFNSRKPRYNDDSDYKTNAPSYYDDLARTRQLIKKLASRIWDYEKTLEENLQKLKDKLAEIEHLIGDGFSEAIEILLREWLQDGTLDDIINEELMNQKVDKDEYEKEKQKSIYTEGYIINDYFDDESNTKYWITEILTDEDTPIEFGYSQPYDTVRNYAYKHNTTLSINSSLGSSTIMIVDRKIIGDDVPANYNTLGITTDNKLLTIPEGLTPSEILEEYPNVVSVHGGFQPLYEDNQKINTDRFPHFKNKHPRNVIGVKMNGNIFFLTTGGRGIDGDGMTEDDIFRVLITSGVNYEYLYMLDGGGSNSIVEKGVLINKPMDSSGERKLPGTINLMKGDNERKSAYEIMKLTEFIGDNKHRIDQMFRPKTTNDLNNITENGYYWAGWRAEGSPKPESGGSDTSSWLVLHINYYDTDRMQIAFEYGNMYNISIRRTNSSTGEWVEWRNTKDYIGSRFDTPTINNLDNIEGSGHFWVDANTQGVPSGVDTNTWYLVQIQKGDSKMQLLSPFALEETDTNVYRRRTLSSGNWTEWKLPTNQKFIVETFNGNLNDINQSGHYWIGTSATNVPSGVDTNTWYLTHVQTGNSKMQLIYPFAITETEKNVYRRRTLNDGDWTQWK